MKYDKKKKTNYEKFMKIFDRSIKFGEVTRIALKDLIDDIEILGLFPSDGTHYRRLLNRRVRLYVDFDSIDDYEDWKNRIEE